MVSAVYEITLADPPDDLDVRIIKLLAAEELPREKKGKIYDLRPLVEDLQRLPENEDGTTRLTMQLAARVSATGRADQVLLALGIPPTDCRIERTRLILNE